MELGVKVTGLEEFRRAFEKLAEETQGPIARKAIKAGNKPILKAMQSRVPVDTGELRESLGERVIKTRGKITLGLIGPQVGSSRGKATAAGKRLAKAGFADSERWRIAHLVEYGHGGPHPAPPHPFARPAREEAGAQAEAKVIEVATKEIEKLFGSL